MRCPSQRGHDGKVLLDTSLDQAVRSCRSRLLSCLPSSEAEHSKTALPGRPGSSVSGQTEVRETCHMCPAGELCSMPAFLMLPVLAPSLREHNDTSTACLADPMLCSLTVMAFLWTQSLTGIALLSMKPSNRKVPPFCRSGVKVILSNPHAYSHSSDGFFPTGPAY